MKKLIGSTLLLAFVSLAFSQQAKEKSALQSMVDTELAFARMAAEQGIRPSFMAFIAEDGILFRPRAVKGKEWMIDHPLPPSDKNPLLSWYPTFADISRAGDMGYTTGPWEFKNDVHDVKPAAFGNFLTAWEKQADGSWRFAVDLGISHPQPSESAAALFKLPKNYKEPAKGRVVNTEAERAILIRRERELSAASATRGARAAFLSNAAASVRVLREDQLPLVGKEKGASVIPTGAHVWTWQPEAWDVSRSGDLGYSYGTYQLKNHGSNQDETGNYFRIWRKQTGVWKVVVDLTNPVPEKKE
jgi:ketosteroid isomerase-like protein